jgi:hypothetical protein
MVCYREHDPDIQHLPFLAVSTRFFYNLYSTFHKRILKFDGFARLVVPYQNYLFLPVLSLGRFNLIAMSWSHQLNLKETDGTDYRYLELVLMGMFWVWYGGLLWAIDGLVWKLIFLYVSHASTLILHLQITLSHFAMSTEDVGPDELFVSKAVRTTMNGMFVWSTRSTFKHDICSILITICTAHSLLMECSGLSTLVRLVSRWSEFPDRTPSLPPHPPMPFPSRITVCEGILQGEWSLLLFVRVPEWEPDCVGAVEGGCAADWILDSEQ